MAWQRQDRVDRAFSLLDEAGKGFVVLEDLQRVAHDFLDDDVTAIQSDEDIQEMIREIDQSGDGILFKEDFYRLANRIHL